MPGTIILAFAFVFACIAAVYVQTIGRVHFGWLALAFLILGMILNSVGLLR